MSLAEIEAELGKMTPNELRRLALKSWTAFVEKETGTGAVNECPAVNENWLCLSWVWCGRG